MIPHLPLWVSTWEILTIHFLWLGSLRPGRPGSRDSCEPTSIYGSSLRGPQVQGWSVAWAAAKWYLENTYCQWDLFELSMARGHGHQVPFQRRLVQTWKHVVSFLKKKSMYVCVCTCVCMFVCWFVLCLHHAARGWKLPSYPANINKSSFLASSSAFRTMPVLSRSRARIFWLMRFSS